MALEIQGLTVKIDRRNILRDVSLSFSSPLTWLIGLNGSGKTTLFRSIAGELDYEGKISLEGKNLAQTGARERAKLLARVPQRLTVPFEIPVRDFVRMGRQPHLGWLGNYSSKDESLTDQALETMELTGFAGQNLQTLSGGELQRALLARALNQASPWMLLDEPAQALDPRQKAKTYALIRELARKGKKIICITHDQQALESEEAVIVGIREGKVCYQQEGPADFPALNSQVYGLEEKNISSIQ